MAAVDAPETAGSVLEQAGSGVARPGSAFDRLSGALQYQIVNTLGFRELRRLFPEASLIRERFLGSTESLVAMRRP